MKIYLIAALIALSACATPSLPPAVEIDVTRFRSSLDGDASDLNVLVTNRAVEHFSKKYTKLKNHKAFAHSKSGAWAYKSDFRELWLAVEGALGACELHNKSNQDQPCKVVNINGHWASEF